MTRYSRGHNAIKVGAYLVPCVPIWLLAVFYPHVSYPATYLDLAVLWVIGLLISYAMIAIHECGHVAVARLVGIEIAGITIGHWKRLLELTVGKVAVTVRAAPASGFVRFRQTPTLLSLPAVSATLLAGVFAETAVVVFAAGMSAPAQIETFGALIVTFSRLAVLYIGGLHIVVNLLPHNVWVAGALHPNDGLQLLHLWRRREHLPVQRELLTEAMKLDRLVEEKRFPEAIALGERLLARGGENFGLIRYLGSLHIENGDTAKAEAIWRDLLNQPMGSEAIAETMDHLCSLVIYHGRFDLVAEADAWSNYALTCAPGAVTLEGTRGAILIEFGRINEGVAMLRKVIKRTECPVDRVIGCSYLAKASAAKGDMKSALEWMEKARAVDPDHRVVVRIGAELRDPYQPLQTAPI